MTEAAIEEEKKELAKQYKQLLKISYRTLSKEDKKLIRSAFDLAVDAHKEQRRKSGEAYIFHPIAVAKIVASEIGLDATSIAAALLHDVVEDTQYTLEDIEKNVRQYGSPNCGRPYQDCAHFDERRRFDAGRKFPQDVAHAQ